VGTHETLLAYLVRRLLENGANTSFVNRIADHDIPLETLVEDPVVSVEQMAAAEGTLGLPHPAIALPRDLYAAVPGLARPNSSGLDLANEAQLRALAQHMAESAGVQWAAAPLLSREVPLADAPAPQPVRNPAQHQDVMGTVQEAGVLATDQALADAAAFAPTWAATPPAERAAMLERAADALEADMPRLLGLLAREAGKTCANGVAEVREAVDFLRYYAAQARSSFDSYVPASLGPVVCISPWNFPLAIFTGQVAAALAAGNPVLAKPAEQTPLVAAEAVRVLWAAGVPRAALQLLPGRGEVVGARLVADARVQGVMFTGSTEVARILQRTLAQRLGAHGQPVPLIAETGGQNAMIVDSSALAEQVVADVVASAFDSAGQRCSALRVLCVQEDAADRIVQMLKGAMAELQMGQPGLLATDVGPVIDEEARQGIERHVANLQAQGRAVHRIARGGADAVPTSGTFVPPTLIELDHLGELQREVFGPVLHLVRYRRKDLGALLQQINATGYGLTLGLHTRIDETIQQVVGQAHAGNVYVNRNMVGAVVGVQPFGGEGLSGTGPKAGGPLYLYRLLAKRPDDVLARAVPAAEVAEPRAPLAALQAWAAAQGQTALAAACAQFALQAQPVGQAQTLAGPTGERNVYTLVPRERVACVAGTDADLLVQLAAVLAVGARAIWARQPGTAGLHARLPAAVREQIALVDALWAADTHFDAVLHHGDATSLAIVTQRLAERAGPIVGVSSSPAGSTAVALERLVVERALSINTAAAGGNASLMTIG